MAERRIGIAIPNYNYGRYIATAVRSALDQGTVVSEVAVSDNCSTDDSLDVLGQIDDDRLQVSTNATNVGFARNVDCAVSRLESDWALVLSSDDLLEHGAIDTYRRLLDLVGDDDQTVVLGSRSSADSELTVLRLMGPDARFWPAATLDRALSDQLGADVYQQSAAELLARCTPLMRNPFPFLTTLYPTDIWRRTGGYSGRLVNPDKWFAWKALAEAERVFWVDAPIARYRVHDQNQTSQMQAIGALKFLVDEYVTTFEVSNALLERAGLPRSTVERGFIKHDCLIRGAVALADGDRSEARRHFAFAAATYPQHHAWLRRLLQAAAATGPLGTGVAGKAVRVLERR